MSGPVEQRGVGVASCSSPKVLFLPCRLARLQGRKRCVQQHVLAVAQVGQVQTEPMLTSTRQGPGAGQVARLPRHGTLWRSLEEEPALPLFTCLDGDILTPANKFAYYEALRSGLKALRALGINGICVDVYWGIVEGVRPREYDWSSYKQLFALIRDEGFMVQACLCFHATEAVPLPAWLVEAGRTNPDIYYTDRAGARCTDCVSLGANEVPVLAGRTPLECYRDMMMSFRRELGPLLGTTITDVLIGLGPDGELKYPAHPRDKRWTFPGVGEFQCYDKYMLSGLRASAQKVSQPSWGLRGPHDAGSYCMWPHQTGFFHQRGNWGSPYGKFFLQWYGNMLLQHADAVLRIAREVFGSGAGFGGGDAESRGGRSGSGGGYRMNRCANGGGVGDGGYNMYDAGIGDGGMSLSSYGDGDGDVDGGAALVLPPTVPGLAAAAPTPVRLHAKLPNLYWWYGTASHGPELTAGYYNTATRDGYLPALLVLARHGVRARLRGAELRGSEVHTQACCEPERQLAQMRTVAAALHVPVGLENQSERFDEAALSRLEAALFDTSVHQGIELPQVQSLVFNRMCDSMFEPGNWGRFKDFVRRVRNRADTLVVPCRGHIISAGPAMTTTTTTAAAAAAASGPVMMPPGGSGGVSALQLV